MQPSFGGPLWSVLTIVNDGDGGSGSRNYVDKLIGKQPTQHSNLNRPKHANNYPYVTNLLTDASQFGHSIATDQNFMLVGVPYSDLMLHQFTNQATPSISRTMYNQTGMVVCYVQMLGLWSRVGEFNAPLNSGIKDNAKFGTSVDVNVVNENMTLAVVGAPGINTAYAYQWLWNDASKKQGQWHVEGVLTHPDASQREHMFAAHGAVAMDNEWIVVGASGSERVFVYKRKQLVSHSADSNFVELSDLQLYGANLTGVVGTQPRGKWVLSQVLEASTHHQVTLYDSSLMHNSARREKGRTSAPIGTMQHKIYITPAEFGWSVDIHQDTIVVGSPSAGYANELVSHSVKSESKTFTTNWQEGGQGKGTTNSKNKEDGTVRRSPDLNLNQNIRRTSTGAVYVFTFRDNTSTVPATMYNKWHEHEILQAPDKAPTDRFGEAISIDADVVVVGSPGDELQARTTWNFEQGNLVGWTRTGTAFDNQPTRGDNSNYRYVYGVPVSHGHRGTSMRNHNEGDRTGLKDELRDALFHYYGGDPQPSGFIGRYWIGTYESNPDTTPFDPINGYPNIGFEQGDVPQGTLTSEVFAIVGSEISFMIGGGCDIKKVYVELLIEGEGSHFSESMRSLRQDTYSRHGVDTSGNFYSVLRASGQCKETMARTVWNVEHFIGRTGQIRIVDQSSSRWAHINVDDFRFSWFSDGAKNWNASQHDTDYLSGCGQGQCGGHEGADAGAAYVFRRRDKHKYVQTGLVLRYEPCQTWCNQFGCYFGTKLGEDERGNPIIDERVDRYVHCTWEFQQKLQPTDRRAGQKFGSTVYMEDETGTIVVGALVSWNSSSDNNKRLETLVLVDTYWLIHF